jgi:uncharacterized protein YqfA (UPF0365 family)
MAKFAAILEGVVYNVIEADTLETANAVSGLSCVEYSDDLPLSVGQELTEKQIADAHKAIEKIKADKAKAEAKAEADRVKAIEAENERLRSLQAERLAAEEAAKPKPVTGIFVKVENN